MIPHTETVMQLMIMSFLAGRGEAGATEAEIEFWMGEVIERYFSTEDKQGLIRWKDQQEFNPLEEFGL